MRGLIRPVEPVGIGGAAIRSEFHTPFRPGAATTQGGVGAALETDLSGQQTFKPTPGSDALKQAIQNIGYGAVVTFDGIGIMEAMMFAGLQKVDVLKEGVQGAIFFSYPMFPFVKLFRSKQCKYPDMLGQEAEPPGDQEKQ